MGEKLGLLFRSDEILEETTTKFVVELETISIDSGNIWIDKIFINGRPYLIIDEVCNKFPSMTPRENITDEDLQSVISCVVTKEEHPLLWENLEP